MAAQKIISLFSRDDVWFQYVCSFVTTDFFFFTSVFSEY